MEVNKENSYTKQCFKCDYNPVLDNLNIVYNSSNSKLFLWNKYQIFMYKDTEMECLEKIFNPEFKIHLTLVSNNHILCVDSNGNIHLTSLKFKSSTQKSLKIPFQSRDHDIKTCVKYTEDLALSLKYEAEAYFLCLNRINTDFQLLKQIILLCGDEHWSIEQNDREKYLLITHSLNKNNFQQLNKIFKLEDSNRSTCDLVLISFDRHSVYGCIFSSTMTEEEVNLLKIYAAPAEICSLELTGTEKLYLIIGLKMGTIIKICLNETATTPEIEHLNTSLSKIAALNDCLLYTDGTTMWKAENILSNHIKLTQVFLKNVKDIAKCGDCVIATTYSNLIYKFSVEDKSCYLNSKEIDEYCPAEELINNSTCFTALFQEMDKNNEIVKQLQKEEDYITAIALSKRQDIVCKAISMNIVVYEHYDEVNQKFTLTEEIADYFAEDTWQILVNITNTNIYNTLNDILSRLSGCISIYVTISSEKKILKTICLKMEEPLKSVNYLIPIQLANETEIKIGVKIVVNIPEAIDQKNSLTILYKKDINLTAEHFIKTSQMPAVKSLKTSKDNIENQVQKFNSIQYGHVFEFTDVSNLESIENKWTFYVKLPDDYKKIFETNKYTMSNLNTEKTKSIMLQLSSEEFLKAKKELIFSVANEKVKIKVQNDGFTYPLIKVSSKNTKIAYSLRNYFAKIVYNEYENCESGKEFISNSFYTTTENFHKAVKKSIKSSTTFEEFQHLMEQFERNVMGALPL